MQRQKQRMSTVVLMAGLALGMGLSVAGAQIINDSSTAAQRGSLSEKDYRFVEKAGLGGLEEVQSGELARQKGVNRAVRSFGERMVADHGTANADLKQMLSQKNATLPTQLSHHERSTSDELQKLSGVDFDKAYAKAMVKDHRKDVKDFENEAKNAQDPDVKAWAQKTLPVLQEHLRLAEHMEAAVKSEK